MHRQAEREPVGEAAVVTVRALLGGPRRVALVGEVGEGDPQEERSQDADRRHAEDQPHRPGGQQHREVAGGDEQVVPDEVAGVAGGQPPLAAQPEEPLVRHGDRPERQAPEAARPEEQVGILPRLVGVGVVQEVGAAEVGERHHAGEQGQPPPEGVAAPGGADEPVDRLVGHDRAEEREPGAEQDIGGPSVPGGRDEEEPAETQAEQDGDHGAARQARAADGEPPDAVGLRLAARRLAVGRCRAAGPKAHFSRPSLPECSTRNHGVRGVSRAVCEHSPCRGMRPAAGGRPDHAPPDPALA